MDWDWDHFPVEWVTARISLIPILDHLIVLHTDILLFIMY